MASAEQGSVSIETGRHVPPRLATARRHWSTPCIRAGGRARLLACRTANRFSQVAADCFMNFREHIGLFHVRASPRCFREIGQTIFTLRSNYYHRQVLTVGQRSNQLRQIKCCPVSHLVIKNEEIVLDLTLNEPLRGVAIWARHDVIPRLWEQLSERIH